MKRLGPGDVLWAYNAVMAEAGLPALDMRQTRRKGDKLTRYEQLAQFAAWCGENGVDPRRYIRARHEAIGYKHRIAVKSLRSDSFLKSFRRFGNDRQAAFEGQLRVQAAVVDDSDHRGGELRELWELMKRRIAGTVECAIDTDMTGGWNPRSPWCRDCALADECRDALPEAVRYARS